MFNNLAFINWANNLDDHAKFWRLQSDLNRSIETHISIEQLNHLLEDLPIQFDRPQPRPWQPINWQNIDRQQLIGIDLWSWHNSLTPEYLQKLFGIQSTKYSPN